MKSINLACLAVLVAFGCGLDDAGSASGDPTEPSGQQPSGPGSGLPGADGGPRDAGGDAGGTQ